MRDPFLATVVLGSLLIAFPMVSFAQTAGSAPGTASQTDGQPTIPPLTPADRQAAFPPVTVPPVEDDMWHSTVLVDRFEWQHHDGRSGPSWEARGWLGGDRNRLWIRTEGDIDAAHVEGAEAHALYGRAMARWWDWVAGIREDVRPGSPQTWAAVGLQGLAPYWFEVEATAYIGANGRTQFRFETEYELLVTNRLVLQPLVEVNVFGKADPTRGIGDGLATTECGLRLRYVVRREFAPYVGVTWNTPHYGTADLARAAGDRLGGARLTIGARLWR